ncbi:1-deoxy-D-xylulose 5-phosphate reductoisomerase [Candidatus Kryptonium thompsonii]|jgi:1-deoxy-D-xylulose-5-phosphate reductoisomerase|uniref:1-deoxy-D-xylulose 5-phosphate reductoisomerase n=1 Tax=Candidatus Kryptonium thompsonii TaxID=1633631 RepID=A0A0N7MSQ7_9BACT|nr:1-deoxy-D-xylulose-5-phosphate reductoisomerase [Candidatus Kryptonium thompsoni]CUS77221.1 1-deoxy-D-xylulose 5-phosphate reductoisomerase [Candidatus Kryptonium thompsoni]CUS88115.1 1-deoxy-D-xylulose 5-phosphate reductoisomerase [Candidatus Kryptonium thompsoni]CUS93167.1 1-deoxy-D-xylulose 5-phosphate reductoisomerase [Candidatus Kryptonium thompsoni]CUT05537.1 1-deoxy-D-xylulose 5-phosphate reductoisomerase [Candidatus Kryptonium thompsoni]CUU08236.1 1-deoxy-D-xylulose 5-phosphate redu
MKRIAILGSTGSIGKNAIEVILNFPNRFKVTYLAVNKNIKLLLEQVKLLKPKGVVIFDKEKAEEFSNFVNGEVEVLSGEEGLLEVVSRDDVDIVLNSLVGFSGLKPTIKAIESKKRIALANKETLVVAGEIITKLLRENNVELIPVDSEHNAIFQCLVGEKISDINRIILTASGGPFLYKNKAELENVTVEEALKHPNWKMGSKITIDSATLMNKGLEVIEAHWIFGLPVDKIKVVIHPQSVIHSMVEFIDGSIKAQLGVPDMKIPIQYALTYPERKHANYGQVDFVKLGQMTFLEPDLDKFECLKIAYEVAKLGGTYPTVLNAANEVAVEAFLNRKIKFTMIPEVIKKAIDAHKPKFNPDLDDILTADSETRKFVKNLEGMD